jgi:ABC-type phosphate transport system substrate-binding protein
MKVNWSASRKLFPRMWLTYVLTVAVLLALGGCHAESNSSQAMSEPATSVTIGGSETFVPPSTGRMESGL